jgi:pimeloyl-ACP methyl ester carboxylesterase
MSSFWSAARRLFKPDETIDPPPTPVAVRSRFFKQAPKDGDVTRLIVFIHGVMGSAPTTWGDAKAPEIWPSMVGSDARFSSYDIYLVNYPTPPLGQAPDIYETATGELNYLKDRGIFKQYREIHFIAHSMGGLIAKRMLTSLRDSNEMEKLKQVLSLVCLATPAQGAQIASVAHWFSANSQFEGMMAAHMNESIKQLEDSWFNLLRQRDKSFEIFPQVHCAYETLKMFGILVVPREMANTRCDSTLYPMPFNHTDMTKVTRTDEDPYLWTMARVLDAASDFSERQSLGAGQYRT